MPDPRNLAILAAIIALVFALSKATFKVRHNSPTWAHFLHTGILYVLCGMIIGPAGFDIFKEVESSGQSHSFTTLSPLIQFGLGWIGFLFGSHMQWRYMKQFSPNSYIFVCLQSCITIAALSVTSFFILSWAGWPAEHAKELYLTCMILGVIAANTAPAAVFAMSRRARTGPTMSLLQFTSALDDVPGVVLLGVLYGGSRLIYHPLPLSQVAFLFVLSTGIGIVLGVILKVLLDTTKDVKVEAMMLMAIICFASGVTGYLQLSTIYVCSILGITFIHASDKDEDVYKILADREHTIYALLMVLSGMMITLDSESLLLAVILLPVYILTRIASKYFSCLGLSVTLFRSLHTSPHIGLGLLSQGGMAIPIAIAYRLSFHDYFGTDMVFVLVIFAVVINEVVSAYSTRGLLKSLERSGVRT